MAKSKNHTHHNQNRKDHRNGVKRVQPLRTLPKRQIDGDALRGWNEGQKECQRKYRALKLLYKRRNGKLRKRLLSAREAWGRERAAAFIASVQQEKEDIKNPAQYLQKVIAKTESRVANIEVDIPDRAEEEAFWAKISAQM